MIHLASGANTEPVKYAILVLATPRWWPFAKALWKSLNDALREEGGLLGRAPSEEELREMQAEDPVADAMISEERNSPFAATKLGGARPGVKSGAGPARGSSVGRRGGFGRG
jgi:hypothetical protein